MQRVSQSPVSVNTKLNFRLQLKGLGANPLVKTAPQYNAMMRFICLPSRGYKKDMD